MKDIQDLLEVLPSKENMPVIPVDANHLAASAARRTVGERQHAPTCTSPLRVAKTKATMVMHNALAPAAPRHPRADSASFAGASFAMATSAAVCHPFPPLSVASVTVMIRRLMGGGGAAVGRKSFGLTDDFSASQPASPNFSTGGGDDVSVGRGMILMMICPLIWKQASIVFWIALSITWSG